jgi:protein tyrosine phosphatase
MLFPKFFFFLIYNMAKKTIKKYYKKNKKTQKGGGFFSKLKSALGFTRKKDSFNIVSGSNNKDSFNIVRYKWTGWPDMNVPNMEQFKKIMYRFLELLKKGGNTYIHCSAGVGRTGTFYVILSFELQNVTPKSDDINNAINFLRAKRNALMVQTEIQYKFILDYFGIIDDNYSINFRKLNRVQPTNKCVDHNYNRYGNIQQFSYSMAKIDNCNTQSDNAYFVNCEKCYINAAEIETINGIRFFAGQCPTPESFPNFYKMLYHNKIKRIIMLTDFIEKTKNNKGKEIDKQKCDEYFPNQIQSLIKQEIEYNDETKTIEIRKIGTFDRTEEEHLLIDNYNFKVI